VVRDLAKGCLFSVLTKPSEVNAPQNYEEMLAQKQLMLTSASYSDDHLIEPNIIQRKLRQFLKHGVSNFKLESTIRKFNRALVASNYTVSELAFYRLYHVGRIVKALTEDQSHFYIGSNLELSIYSFLTSFKVESCVTRGPDLHLFLDRVPFIVRSNFFSPHFTGGMFQIVESGVWEFWTDYMEAAKKWVQMKKFIYLRSSKNEPWLGSPIAFNQSYQVKSIYNLFYFIWGPVRTPSNIKPLCFKRLSIVFWVYAAGICFALMVYLLEVFGFIWQKRLVRKLILRVSGRLYVYYATLIIRLYGFTYLRGMK
ncbi:unnamed protein product, partial [Allacma fusca]